MRVILLWFLWIGTSALLAFPALGQEARCAELGSVCRCSETYDGTGFETHGSGSKVGVTGDGNSTKQCSDTYNLEDSVVSRFILQDETGMPAGNQVSKVLRYDASAGANKVWTHTGLAAGTKRRCIRNYFRLGTGYLRNTEGINFKCDGGKFQEQQLDGALAQLQVGSGGCSGATCPFTMRHIWTGHGTHNHNNLAHPGSVTGDLPYADCVDEWCIIETCISGDYDAGATEFFHEGYVRRLSDGKTQTWNRLSMGSGYDAGSSFQTSWAPNGFRGNDTLTCLDETAPEPGHWREHSYTMLAEWTTDEGQFIGAASEIEGGASEPTGVLALNP